MIADWLTVHGLGWLVAGLPWIGATVLTQANIPTMRNPRGNSPVTWTIWAALSAFAITAQVQMGGWTAAAILLVPVTGVATVIAVGALVHYRDAEPGVPWQRYVDRVCAAGAAASLAALVLADDPGATLVLTLVTDIIAPIPPITMAWWPSPEAPVPTTPYISVAISAGCTLAAASGDIWQLLYPIYLVVLGVGMTAIIVARRPFGDDRRPPGDWLDPAAGRPLRSPPEWTADPPPLFRDDPLHPDDTTTEGVWKIAVHRDSPERTVTVSTQRLPER